MASSLKYLLVVILGLLSVVGGVEEHGDPKEHARREGKSKFKDPVLGEQVDLIVS